MASSLPPRSLLPASIRALCRLSQWNLLRLSPQLNTRADQPHWAGGGALRAGARPCPHLHSVITSSAAPRPPIAGEESRAAADGPGDTPPSLACSARSAPFRRGKDRRKLPRELRCAPPACRRERQAGSRQGIARPGRAAMRAAGMRSSRSLGPRAGKGAARSRLSGGS